jgi:hypothetical protein
MAIDPREINDLKNGDIQEIDGEFLEQAKISWFTRALLAVAVPWGLGRLAKELGGPGIEMSKKAHSLFAKVERVDIIPSRSEMRGFQIVIDNILSLFFCQDGDHFVYDGFEMGLCEDGDVTVFDKVE